jgi:hypothetical protein
MPERFNEEVRCAGIHHSAHSVRGREPLPAHAPAELTARMHARSAGGRASARTCARGAHTKECGGRTSARASARGSDEGKCNEAADYADSSTVWRTVAQPGPRASPWSIDSWEALTHTHPRTLGVDHSRTRCLCMHTYIHTCMHAFIHAHAFLVHSDLVPRVPPFSFPRNPQPTCT